MKIAELQAVLVEMERVYRDAGADDKAKSLQVFADLLKPMAKEDVGKLVALIAKVGLRH